MKTKSFRSTHLLLISAIVIAGLVWFSNMEADPDASKVQLFGPVVEEDINLIKVRPPNQGTYVIAKQENEWVLTHDNNFPANLNIVNGALQAVQLSYAKNVVSDNIENHENYYVTPETGILVQMGKSEEDISIDFLIGKEAPGFSGHYIRLKDSDEVIELPGNLRSLLNVQTEGFRHRGIFSFTPEIVSEVIVSSAADTQIFKKQESVWILEGMDNADSKKIEKMVRLLGILTSGGFVMSKSETKTYGLTPGQEEVSVSVTFDDGSTKKLLIGLEDELYYGKFEGREEIYKISEPSIKQFYTQRQAYEKVAQ